MSLPQVHVPHYQGDPHGEIKKKLRTLANEISQGSQLNNESVYHLCIEACDHISDLQYELEGYQLGYKKDSE